MKFEIIGTGAIGLLFGSKLSQAKFDVALWCRTSQITEMMNESGFSFIPKEGRLEERYILNSYNIADVDSLPANDQGDYIYGIVTVKQVHIDSLFVKQLCLLQQKRKFSAIVLMQNGVGHVEQLAHMIDIPIITAVTSEAAKRHHRYKIEHTGAGHTYLGDELGRDFGDKHQQNIEKALQIAGFSVSMSKNIKEYIYRKLIINCVINPLTSIFDCTNGELPQKSERRLLMKALFNETINIVNRNDQINVTMSFEEILTVCEATASNTSSMRADILHGRQTEIANINGAIVEMAKKYNVLAPLNEGVIHFIEALHPIG